MPHELEVDAEKTLLLIEDEVLLRGPLAQYLRDCGYTVIEAADYDEAMQILEHQEQVDIVMSGLGRQARGFELAKWLRANRPHVPVMLNGSVETASKEAGELCEEGPMGRKPYDARTVEDEVRRLLATARVRGSAGSS
jgi:CheY-like chemotaxis protein